MTDTEEAESTGERKEATLTTKMRRQVRRRHCRV